jgi:hypothetical protein
MCGSSGRALPSKHEALTSNPSTEKKKKNPSNFGVTFESSKKDQVMLCLVSNGFCHFLRDACCLHPCVPHLGRRAPFEHFQADLPLWVSDRFSS